MSDIIMLVLRDLMILGMLVYIWVLKYRMTHPRKLTDLVETDAEITSLQFQKRWLWSSKESARVTLYAKYQKENGKITVGQLATYPVRGRLDALAPELLEKGTKIRICYERKRSGVFYLADPRYASEEIAGTPRQVRIGYFGLTVLTLFMLALMAFLWYLELLPE